MSGICGIVNFDGAPVDPDLLRKMAEAASYRGPDGINYWIEGNVGLAHLALHTTPESVRERQPLVNRRGDLVLTADARVDNREELISTLTIKGHLQVDHPTDADLILAAYECWGEECPKHMVGDFAFAVWDKKEQKLFCARDQMGARVLHYRFGRGIFQWSTDAAQLLEDLSFPIQYNERQVAQDLIVLGGGDIHESYYQDVFKLKPSWRASVSAQWLKIDEYWDFDPDARITYSSETEYGEHFLDLLRQSVRSRLRSIRPVGIFMSGGIDSTSVACVAADEMANRPAGIAPKLEAVNWTVLSKPEFSETERSRTVAERWGIGYREIAVDNYLPLTDFPAFFTPHRDEPCTVYLYSFQRASLQSFVPNERPRVWLTGYMGDMTVGGANLFSYWNQCIHLNWNGLIKDLQQHARVYGFSNREMLFNVVLSQALSGPINWYKRRFSNNQSVLNLLNPHWVGKLDLRSWYAKQEPLYLVDVAQNAVRWKDPARNWRYRRIKYEFNVRGRQWFNRYMSEFQAEQTDPWEDIRLLQFLLAIPQEQISKGLMHKNILRNALAGLLPDEIRLRRARRSGAPLYPRSVAGTPEYMHTIYPLFEKPCSVAQGWIVRDRLQEILNDDKLIVRSWAKIWRVATLEMWLQTRGAMPLN